MVVVVGGGGGGVVVVVVAVVVVVVGIGGTLGLGMPSEETFSHNQHSNYIIVHWTDLLSLLQI